MIKKFFIVVLIILALAFIGYKVYQKLTSKAGEKTKAFAIAIEAVDIKRENIRDLRLFTGSLSEWSMLKVAPKVGGYWIAQGNIEVGQELTNKDFIGKIDDTEYKHAYNQAQANYNVTLAELSEATNILSLRKSEYSRQVELGNSTSKASLETAEYAMKSQEATVQVKDAELKRQKASLEIAKLHLNDTHLKNIVISEDGRHFVSKKMVSVGDLIAPNQVILEVVDISKLKGTINVIEKDYPHIYVGQKAEIYTDAYPEECFIGKIEHVAKTLNNSSRQAAIEISIDNKQLKLKPGMFVRVYLEFSKSDDAQIIPRNALVKQNGIDGIFLLNIDDESVEFVKVKTGIILGEEIQIVEPKNLNKPVVTLGNHLLIDNSRVIIPAKYKKLSE